MYINTFKYTPKDVSCQLCTEYVKSWAVPPCAARGWPSVSRPVWSATARPSWKHSPATAACSSA